MTLKEVLDRTTEFFKKKSILTPRLDAELLLGEALGLERIALYLNFEKPMSEEELSRCREMVKRRAEGEPVAYILGHREFYGLTFKVNQHVLVPRPETEHIIDEVLSWVERKNINSEELDILDLGTGSGCLAITLAKKLIGSRVTAVDISTDALSVAKENAKLNEVDVTFHNNSAEELAEEVYQSAQVVVANPPYIAYDDENIQPSVKAHEPNMALFAEDDGFYFIAQWLEKVLSTNKIKPALVVMEIGSQQGPRSIEYVKQNWPQLQVEIIKDYAKHDRLLVINLGD